MSKEQVKSVDLARIRKELQIRKQELEEQLESMSREQIVDDQVQDSGDQAQSVVMESLRNSLQDAEYEEYDRLVKALAAIDAGTYGICADCGVSIGEKRLKHFPNASRCIACQEAFEARKQ